LKSAVNADERLKDLMAVALRLEGLARHASTHAAGVVISPQPLTDLVPVYKTNRDEITTQYDMNALERIGLLKMDFLGLTTLTVLHDTVRMVEQNRGVKLDLDGLTLDDADTYKLFTRGDTTAIFQFESHGMRDILRRYQPTRIEDLTALNALYRPGTDSGRHDRRLHQPEAREDESHVRAAATERHSGRDLRGHPVSGTGNADREPAGEFLARRSRHFAPRDGQEEKRRDGGAAR
jgi:DNA polymerase III alpha subunit